MVNVGFSKGELGGRGYLSRLRHVTFVAHGEEFQGVLRANVETEVVVREVLLGELATEDVRGEQVPDVGAGF